VSNSHLEQRMALYAFDGTWNSATLADNVEQENETNVANFCEAYYEQTWYVPGPGTRFGDVGHVLGGATGLGGRTRVKELYQKLCEAWAAGDTIIDVVGFSRGAALALDFANKIVDGGIRRPGTKQVVEESPKIRFLGLWDVVGSFGVPINVGFLDTQEFNPGGNGNVGLSYIALRWMLGKAKAAGLPITEAAIASRDGKINPDAPLRPPKDLIAAFCRATASITRWSKEQGITILRQVHSVRPRRMTHKPAVSRTFPSEKRSQFNRARGMVIASSLQQPAKGCKKCVFCRGVINTCVASAGIAECGAFKRN
jgi:hypothetical protein